LERQASDEDRAYGFDLADYLMKYQPREKALPDIIYIPPHVANTVEAIAHCIEAQRSKKAA
jgi:hypothetical protein